MSDTVAVRVMCYILLLVMASVSSYLIGKAVHTPDFSNEGTYEIITGVVGIIGCLILGVILIISGVM